MSRFLTLAAPFPFLAVLVLFFVPVDEYLNGYERAFGTEIKIPRAEDSGYRVVKIEASQLLMGILLTAVVGGALAYSKRYRMAAIVGSAALAALLMIPWLNQRAFENEAKETMERTGSFVCGMGNGMNAGEKTCAAAFLVGAFLCGQLGWSKRE